MWGHQSHPLHLEPPQIYAAIHNTQQPKPATTTPTTPPIPPPPLLPSAFTAAVATNFSVNGVSGSGSGMRLVAGTSAPVSRLRWQSCARTRCNWAQPPLLQLHGEE
jgi:hypothetical protein